MNVKQLLHTFGVLILLIVMGCTKENAVGPDLEPIVVVDTIYTVDTIKDQVTITDTFEIKMLDARSDAQYIDDAFVISLDHDDLKNENTGARYRLGVRAFFATIVGESSWDNRTFIRFNDVDFIPEKAIIDSAYMTLFVYHQAGCNSNDCQPLGNNLLDVHAVSENWGEQEITWVNQPEYEVDEKISTTNLITSTITSITLDITSISQYWVTNDNLGLVIKMQDEEGTEKVVEFYSSDHNDENLQPQLKVYYHEE